MESLGRGPTSDVLNNALSETIAFLEMGLYSVIVNQIFFQTKLPNEDAKTIDVLISFLGLIRVSQVIIVYFNFQLERRYVDEVIYEIEIVCKMSYFWHMVWRMFKT